MKKKLKALVGRNVRLKYEMFLAVLKKAKQSVAMENLFVVAAISREMNKLILYGARIRIVVSLSDIVLI